ncbi:glycosyltransferase family 4 protein [Candidatus Daviesbacteria bacterium]|nr:glycosyltransferase family 4 protein [Candidatus Daviesbacteria bacterium]
MRKHLLIIAIGFLPNIGGLETHLKDLIDELIKQNWKIKVLTYQPLNTPVLGKWIEKEKNLVIFRLPVLRGLFYRLLKNPILEFIYLGPLLFLVTPILLLVYPDIYTINAQGVIAGFSTAFWSKIFRKRYVISAQSVYNFPKKGLYKITSQWIFNSADKVIAISNQSKKDVETLGVNKDQIQVYTNWEDSSFFKPYEKEQAKKQIGFTDKFIVSFFGRLIEEKGVLVLIDAIKLCNKDITFLMYGEGPLIDSVKKAAEEFKNIIYMSTIPPNLLPLHYSAADLVLMPTLNEEGFGRVAAGALFCGTPVIASNRGALPEVVNDLVGKIINPTPEEVVKTTNFLYTHKTQLRKRALRCREYAINRFSEKNAEVIIRSYLGNTV